MIRNISIIGMLLLAGCGPGNRMAQVQGTIKFQGKPLPDAIVLFVPSGGPAAAGGTNGDGSYRLLTKKPGDGVLIGPCKVAIMSADSLGKPLPIPVRYLDANQSGLTADVKSGNNMFNFELTE